ncbi:hypothetical protein P256_00567 [Acinetobacter nectaris CIP 110549]|uniref:Uncharacterized protein n=1 Tax=Acinetobacter nectaris CIP 110549 TaxID=1392540 RepID=V2TRB4_9GAMM|nr:hypothetical protein [Acinetobacter nectaris]ESK40127.1 hypothetical protein P256_00567 [Acinetobacter nectaris CIP 110549]
MADFIIELLEPINLEKEGLAPIFFDKGTLFKVVYDSVNSHLVRADDGMTFSIAKQDQDRVWRYLN